MTVVSDLKENNQDFEWYPTTDEMISVIKSNIEASRESLRYHREPVVLDCGAGDGRVLDALTKGDKLAIEKSAIMRSLMNKNIMIVGTDFNEQVLFDKQVDVVFCNPPYSEFVSWMLKIIRETSAPLVYMVVPSRWADDGEIMDAIKLRKGKHEVIYSGDFLSGDRAARANVDIVKIKMGYRGSANTDAFDAWFMDNFKIDINADNLSSREKASASKQTVQERVNTQLVAHNGDFVAILAGMYDRELGSLLTNYKALESLDPVLLLELDVSLNTVCKSLKTKIEGLKNLYWRELLSNAKRVTDVLCTKQRDAFIDRFMKHACVDFTKSNAYAVLDWMLRHAADYADEQIVDLVESVADAADVIKYKSNDRVFVKEQYRYLTRREELDKIGEYALDLRIVVSGWTSFDSLRGNGLTDIRTGQINDFLVVAYNLGFDTRGYDNATNRKWKAGETQEFMCRVDGKEVTLMTVKVFKNGNTHYKLNQQFLCRLNVAFGKLKGWVKTAKQAADDIGVSEVEAAKVINRPTFAITANTLLSLESK